MAVTDTHTKLMTYQEVKSKTGVDLTEEQLVIIENVYILNRKNAIFQVGMFRFINVFFATIFIIIFWLLKGTEFSEWMFVGMMIVFWFYNLIHCWNNIVDYKRTKLNTFKPFTVGKP